MRQRIAERSGGDAADAESRLAALTDAVQASKIIRYKKVLIIGNGTVVFPGNRYSGIPIVLTPHAIVLCSEHKTAEPFKAIHFLDVRAITSHDSSSFDLATDDETIVFKIDTPDSYLKVVLRAFLFSTPFGSTSPRAVLTLDDPKRYTLSYPFSATERFQLLYHSFAMRTANGWYYPDIVNYYHSQIISHRFSFDFSELPITSPNYTLSYKKFDWTGFTAAFVHQSWLSVLSLSHIAESNLVELCAPIIAKPHLIAVLSLVDVGSTSGLQAIAGAMKTSSVFHWDFSSNKLSDASHFLSALSQYTVKIQVLVLDDMDLNESCVSILFTSLNENPHMHYLKKLSLLDSRISAGNCRSLRFFLTLQIPPATLGLRYLGIGPIDDPVFVFRDLPPDRPPLSTLRLVATDLSEAAVSALLQFVRPRPSLSTLDLARCTGLSDGSLGQLFAAVTTLTRLNLGLGNVGLTPNRLLGLLPRLQRIGGRLTDLTLDGNNFSMDDINGFTSGMHLFPNLRSLSLGGILSAKQASMYQSLIVLLHTTQLEELKLVGNERTALGSDLVPILCDLLGNRTLRRLDIRGNKLNDVGVCTLANLVLANRLITALYADTFELESAKPFKTLLAACAKSESLITMPFPAADARTLRTRNQRDAQDFATLRYEVAKRLYINRVLKGIASPIVVRKDSFLKAVMGKATASGTKRLQTYERAGCPAAVKFIGLDPAEDLLGKFRSRVVPRRRSKGEGSDMSEFSDSSEQDGMLRGSLEEPEVGDLDEKPAAPAQVPSPAAPVVGERRGEAKPRTRALRHSLFVSPGAKPVAPPPGFISLGQCREPDAQVDWGFVSVWPHSDDEQESDSEFGTLPTSRLPAVMPEDFAPG
jgi:hypothetical protein